MNALVMTDRLAKCVMAGEPVLIKGAPGIGKSDMVEQVARITKHDLIVSHPVVSDPPDYKGVPAKVARALDV